MCTKWMGNAPALTSIYLGCRCPAGLSAAEDSASVHRVDFPRRRASSKLFIKLII